MIVNRKYFRRIIVQINFENEHFSKCKRHISIIRTIETGENELAFENRTLNVIH